MEPGVVGSSHKTDEAGGMHYDIGNPSVRVFSKSWNDEGAPGWEEGTGSEEVLLTTYLFAV